ncbi:MAG: dicarboxylate/amino acid:cation symporter [Sphingomonadaceae bacterium]|nr:dicarboxylate/amino acid:cation symporter [Sphingomonadaceae bacterium]
MAKRLTTLILIGLVTGIALGIALNQVLAPAEQKVVAGYLGIITAVFLRLIKMIIAPLVFATLVAGIAHMGDTTALGRIGVRTLLWFLAASLVSLTLGLALVHLFDPGAGLRLPLPSAGESAGLAKAKFDLKEFVTHLVPTSILDAMAKNEVLPIVVFASFFGVALANIGEVGAPLTRALDALMQVMLKVTGYVMWVAPFAVFSAMAASIATEGPGILITFGRFMASFYAGLLVLWIVLFAAGYIVAGRRILALPKFIEQPFLIAFSTASSEAAFPRLLESLERFGVPRRIAGFVLPLGYSFNLDGSMMYTTYASLFIAEVYGVHLSLGQQVTMLLVLLVSSKGIASVPRASLVVIAATIGMFGIPEAALLLILGIDQFLDMGRTATNVVGNAVATTVIAKWEGLLDAPQEVAEPG